MEDKVIGVDDAESNGAITPDVATPDMVVVRNAYKAYGPKSQVLKGLNLTVAEGSIYAFLGPSGCGKTTLLACLVGRKRLDSGEIRLGVTYNHEIGYMPQEIALMKELTIKETLYYYGYLFGMTTSELEKRMNKLLDFLEMPPPDRTIWNLSGGQQRRVSLCATLLHNPKFLILDEPTVGVDPLLSSRIWEYLTELTKYGGKTILLTTHYIEEARQADRVGMMRDGVLLVESEPEQIIRNFGCERLEDVFLELSKKQEINSNNVNIKPQYLRGPLKKRPKRPVRRKNWFSFTRLQAHIIKNAQYLIRNKVILTFMLSLPIIQCILFVNTIGPDPKGLSMGVFNEELVNGRSDCQNSYSNCSLSYPVSCYYMDQLEKKRLNLVLFDNYEDARRAAKKNHVWGFLHIPYNYTESLHVRIAQNMRSSDEILEFSSVNVWMDFSNQYIGNFIRRDLYFAYMDFLEKVYRECDWPVQASRIPINFADAVYGTIYPKFTDFTVPSVLQMFAFYLPVMMVVASILMEKREGLLERSFVSGLSLFEIFLGHSVLSLSLLVIQTMSMFVVFFVMFNNPFMGSVTLGMLLCFVVGFSGMCYGLLVAVICDRDYTATFFAVGSMFPLIFLSGMIWPREGMHPLLQSIGWFLPLTYSTDSLRSISSRGWDMSNPVVYKGFLAAILSAVIFCLGTVLIAKLKKVILRLTS